jgi:hypothetical protein
MLNIVRSTLFAAFSLTTCWALAQHLQCQVFERDQVHQIDTYSLASPYSAVAYDYAHFRFKPVLVAIDGVVSYAKIHVYYQTHSQPELMHIAMYSAPFAVGQSLTGVQTVYSPYLGRQFSYECRWVSP